MASKVLEEFLKTASPEQRGELNKLSQELQNQNVQNGSPTQTQAPADPNQALTDRSDVQQLSQDWQQGKDAKIEKVSDKSDLALADGQIPKNDPSKLGGYDQPKFMDEQGKSQEGQGSAPEAKSNVKQTGQDLQRSDSPNQAEAQSKAPAEHQAPKRDNAVSQALESGSKDSGQAKSQDKQQTPQPSKEPER